MTMEFISSVGLSKTFLCPTPFLYISHFAVILQNRKSSNTNKNPLSNFILFEQTSWSCCFSPRKTWTFTSYSKAFQATGHAQSGQGDGERQGPCSEARADVILQGTVLQGSQPESRLCSGHVRPSHVSWHSRGISSFCPSAPLLPHKPKRSLTSKKKLEMSPCTVNTLRVQLSAS